MSAENLEQTTLELENLKRQVDYELLERDGVSPKIFLQIHTEDNGCFVFEESIGFSNADIPGGGFIIGATEIMKLNCRTHKVTSSSYAKENVIRTRQEKIQLTWRWRW